MTDVLVDRPREHVALVTLNRPHALNSMTLELVDQLTVRLDELESDDTCRVVVLTGAGRGFCSGHDLAELEALRDASVADLWKNQCAYADLTARLCAFSKPVIAAVNGPAAGGGLALALAADTRVCSDAARFNAAFVRLGLSGCDVGVSYLLPRIVGPTLAFEMMLTGRLVEADEAARVGLVLRAVPQDELLEAAFGIAEGISANSPFAVAITKQVMWTNLNADSLQAAIELENRTQVVCTQGAEQREAIAAFLEKRPAVFGS